MSLSSAFVQLSDILDIGELSKGYKLYFKSSKYKNTDDDTADGIARQLDIMFAEIQEFEENVASKWDWKWSDDRDESYTVEIQAT